MSRFDVASEDSVQRMDAWLSEEVIAKIQSEEPALHAWLIDTLRLIVPRAPIAQPAMTGISSALIGPEVLTLFPPFLQLELADNDAFRKRIGVRVEVTITLDRGAVNFPRSGFFSAIRAFYGSPERRAKVQDEDGEAWELVGELSGELDTISRGLFQIGHEKVDRAVKLIRDARHRFPSNLEGEKRDALLAGLAAVACTTRSGDLADDVRLMMRRVRVDRDSPLTPVRELLNAATAAGAYGDLAEWTAFLGDWATELDFAVDRHDEAAALYRELEALCIIEPTLRRTAGRALAALQAYVSL